MMTSHFLLLDIDWLPRVIAGTTRANYLLLFGAAGAFSLMVGFVAAWIGGRFGARSVLKEARRNALGEVNDQLRRMEQSIDVIALEVERISEAQRFAARVAAEPRQSAIAPVQHSPRVITPH